MQSSAEALNHLEDYLRRHRRAALLFSGGLDSSLLLAAAAQALGPGLCAITFAGPHIVPGELAAAWALARRLRVKHLVRYFDPLTLPDFRDNSRRRCYACKRAIITQAWEVAREQGAEVLWDGTNLDDLADFRPGLQAARELGVASPLLAAGLDKAAIRTLSRALGLPGEAAPELPGHPFSLRHQLDPGGPGPGRAGGGLAQAPGLFPGAPAGAGGRRPPAWNWPRRSGRPSWPPRCGGPSGALAPPGLQPLIPGFASIRSSFLF